MRTPAYAYLPLCRDTLAPIMKLAVYQEEEGLIAPVAQWSAQAALTNDARSFGIFADTQAVGLISLIDPRASGEDDPDYQSDCLYVWRVMVDKGARGQGHGRAALDFAMCYAELVGLAGVSLTTDDLHAKTALGFYKRLGFAPTGRRINNEIELVKRR